MVISDQQKQEAIERRERMWGKGVDIDTQLFQVIRGGMPSHIPVLLENANIEARDKSGRTPLMWSVFRGYKKATQVLLARGADINVQDVDGLTLKDYVSNHIWNVIQGWANNHND